MRNKLCVNCGKRKALSPCHSPRGNKGMKLRKQHPYCAECYRDLRNQVQAQTLAANSELLRQDADAEVRKLSGHESSYPSDTENTHGR